MFDNYIQLNEVLVPRDDEQLLIEVPHVIIFIDAQTDRVFAMNMQRNIKPIKLSYRALLGAIESGHISKGLLHIEDYMRQSDLFISKKQLEQRDNKFATIQPILKNMEQFLLPGNYGSKLIEQCLDVANDIGINATRTQVYNWFYRYFRAGCNSNAFLRKPGTGKASNKKYSKKIGPKRKSRVVGRMRNADDERNIRYIANKHLKCQNPKTKRNAFVEYEDRFASEPDVDAITGEIIGYIRWPEEQRLSIHQFMDYLQGYINENKSKFIDAQGKTDKENKDHKGLKANADTFYAEGPGHVYQVDETPLIIELVDEFDPTRTKRMGKPTCYSVIDMFSRTWVAILLTFAKASAHTAREVIFVAFRDKQKFCDEIGVKLNAPWDISGKCRMIFVDNAEFKSELERALSKDAQIEQVYNTEGNSQQKGLVERRHKSLEDFLFGLVPGVGKKNIADYLKKRLRKDALINIRELYQILIDFITRYNNYYPLEGLSLSKEMRLDGVKQIPNSKFQWGLKNRPGYLKPVDDAELYQNLLEVGEVTVHRTHLFLPGKYLKRKKGSNSSKGLKYQCQWTQQAGIQDVKNAGNNTLARLPCRFMRYSLGIIYIETPDGFKPAMLCSEDAHLTEMGDETVAFQKDKITVENDVLRQKYDEEQSQTRVVVENIVTAARQEQRKINVNQANTQDISAHREEAISVEVKLSAKQFAAATNSETSSNANQHIQDTSTNSNAISDAFAAKRAAKKKNKRSRT